MALNKDVLGAALLVKSNEFNDTEIAPEDLAEARENFWKGVAEAIINHITASAVVTVNVTTVGSATTQTGTGTGAIN